MFKRLFFLLALLPTFTQALEPSPATQMFIDGINEEDIVKVKQAVTDGADVNVRINVQGDTAIISIVRKVCLAFDERYQKQKSNTKWIVGITSSVVVLGLVVVGALIGLKVGSEGRYMMERLGTGIGNFGVETKNQLESKLGVPLTEKYSLPKRPDLTTKIVIGSTGLIATTLASMGLLLAKEWKLMKMDKKLVSVEKGVVKGDAIRLARIYDVLIAQPLIDVSIKNIKGETALGILQSYIQAFAAHQIGFKLYPIFDAQLKRKMQQQ